MVSKVVLAQDLKGLERADLYNSFDGFFHDLKDVGTYGVTGTIDVHKSLLNEIDVAGKKLWNLFRNVETIVKRLDEEQLIEYGYPKEIIPFINLDYNMGASLSRFDFIVHPKTNQIKMIELNNDTPFLVVESFLANNNVCNYYKKDFLYESPELMLAKSYSDGIKKAINWLSYNPINPEISILTFSHEVDEEEYLTMDYIRSQIDEHSIYKPNLLDISNMRISYGCDCNDSNENCNQCGTLSRGLYDNNGKRVDVLMRPAYPLEFLINDVDEEGNQVGIELLKLVEEKKLAIISDPSAIIMQSKAFMAIIWNLYHDRKLSREDKSTVTKYMLPTHFNKDLFVKSNSSYVQKPVFSREGSSVEIHENDSKLISPDKTYKDHIDVYQEYIEMPTFDVIVDSSHKEKHLLIGLFVGNEEPIAIGARLGNKITDWDANWIAIAKSKY